MDFILVRFRNAKCTFGKSLAAVTDSAQRGEDWLGYNIYFFSPLKTLGKAQQESVDKHAQSCANESQHRLQVLPLETAAR
jgi:hypothetical protein